MMTSLKITIFANQAPKKGCQIDIRLIEDPIEMPFYMDYGYYESNNYIGERCLNWLEIRTENIGERGLRYVILNMYVYMF